MSAACSVSSSQQPDPPPSWGQRHPPHGGFLTFQLVRAAPLLGLVHGLAADPERSGDLGPRGSFGPGRQRQQVEHIGEGRLGVSHVFQGRQGPLRASLGASEQVGRLTDPPPCVTAFGGAHVNRCCHQKRGASVGCSSIGIDVGKAPELVLAGVSTSYSDGPVVGAPGPGWPLISSYISRRQHLNGSVEEKNDPRDVGASGGRDHHDGMSVWRL
jgi:hypothetical protein